MKGRDVWLQHTVEQRSPAAVAHTKREGMQSYKRDGVRRIKKQGEEAAGPLTFARHVAG